MGVLLRCDDDFTPRIEFWWKLHFRASHSPQCTEQHTYRIIRDLTLCFARKRVICVIKTNEYFIALWLEKYLFNCKLKLFYEFTSEFDWWIRSLLLPSKLMLFKICSAWYRTHLRCFKYKNLQKIVYSSDHIIRRSPFNASTSASTLAGRRRFFISHRLKS